MVVILKQRTSVEEIKKLTEVPKMASLRVTKSHFMFQKEQKAQLFPMLSARLLMRHRRK